MLTPFTDGDWMAFSGCESDEPLIGTPNDKTTVIVDGRTVEAYHFPSDVEAEMVWSHVFASHEAAKNVGELLSVTTVTRDTLNTWLERVA